MRGRSSLQAFAERASGPDAPESALRTLGYRMVGLDDDGEATCSFTTTQAMANLIGKVQGGFIAAMLDATVSSALLAQLDEGQTAPTLELKVSYLEPVPVGAVSARGRVLRRGGSVAFLAGELYDADGGLCATASATVRILRVTPPVEW